MECHATLAKGLGTRWRDGPDSCLQIASMPAGTTRLMRAAGGENDPLQAPGRRALARGQLAPDRGQVLLRQGSEMPGRGNLAPAYQQLVVMPAPGGRVEAGVPAVHGVSAAY